MKQMYTSPMVKNILPLAQKNFKVLVIAVICIITCYHTFSRDLALPKQVAKDLPVKLISFNTALINKKVSLTWITALEKNFSHFVIERSTNGIDFTDAAVIFTEGNSETAKSYSFKDGISTSGNGTLHYRMRMVSLDGKYEHSATRIIQLGQPTGKLALQTFPNPVITELRITIPESWQGKQVVYEVYAHDGQLVKRLVNKSAPQTEIISIPALPAGSYIIKALNDKETASQHIIKGR